MEDGQAADAPCECRPAKSAGAGRSRPVEGTITAFWEKYGISKEQWEEGELSRKKIAALPSLLQWSQGLTKLDLSHNQIMDVSGLTLTQGLTELNLRCNQIVDVSGLTLTEGLTTLNLSYNPIVDVIGLTLTEGKLINTESVPYVKFNPHCDIFKLEYTMISTKFVRCSP